MKKGINDYNENKEDIYTHGKKLKNTSSPILKF